MSTLRDTLFWEREDAATALEVVARRSGLARADAAAGSGSPATRAARLGVDLHGVTTAYDTLPQLVRGAGPAVLSCFRQAQPPLLIAVLGRAGITDRVRILRPDGRIGSVPVARVVQAMRASIEADHAPAVDALLEVAGIRGRRRLRARAHLLSERLRGTPMGGGTLVRAAPHGAAVAVLRDARVLGPLSLSLVARLLSTAIAVAGWTLIGKGALDGRLAAGWVAGWALLLVTGLSLERVTAWGQGVAAIRAGVWTKLTLLRGAMRADPEIWRRNGVGGALARVNESQAIEDLVLSGGLLAVLAVVDLGFAAWVLSQGSGAVPLLLTLAIGSVLLGLAAARLYTLRVRWTGHRRTLTGLLVERMSGHRTRLAQVEPDRMYAGEDDALAAYQASSLPLDRHVVWMGMWLGGGWGAVAVAILGATFVFDTPTPTGLAIALGGILLAQAALGVVSTSLDGLAAAAVSWSEVGELLAGATERPASCQVDAPDAPLRAGDLLLRARGLSFAWPERAPVFAGIDLELHVGDRVLLTGPSGSGKSTLAELLTGLRAPDRGLLLLRGLDLPTMGAEAWRARAVFAPQFNDNHVFENTLAFNLLLGRQWPPSPGDLSEARSLCEALGLGPLVDRMPAGLNQHVGESGWQLSHGERSRIFLARALLQGADLVVLDESFASLDPLSARQCLTAAMDASPTLVVIAHP